MKLPTASALLLLALPAPAANLTGLWEFSNPANIGEATTGNDLIVGGVHTHHANLADDGGTSLSGAITTMGNDTASFLTANHDIAPNGGGAFVNEYSVVVDLFTPVASRGIWRAIFQTTGSPSGNDADYWIRPDNNHLGVGAIGYSDSPIDAAAWTRLIVTVDLRTEITSYLDGALHFTHTASDGVDGRHSLVSSVDQNIIHFFADDTAGENPPMNIGMIAIFDGVLNSSEVAFLGVAGDLIENPPPPVDPPVVTAQAPGPATVEAIMSTAYEFLATDPNSEDVEIQADWGNGVISAWTPAGPSGIPLTISYAYPGGGTFDIRARARDSGGTVSNWLVLQSITVNPAPPLPRVIAGLWEFDNPANLAQATIGNDLVVGGNHIHHASLADDGGNSLSGVITTQGGLASFFTATHDIPANGAGALVNQYSVMVDIFTPLGSRGLWRTVYQTSLGPNDNDGDYWIRTGDSHLGVGDIGYSDAPMDESVWTRLVVTVDLTRTGTDFVAYLNGVPHFAHTVNQNLDGRHALFPLGNNNVVHFFADDTDTENPPMNVGTIALFQGVLTPEEVAAFGGAEVPIGPTKRIKITDISYDGTNPGAKTFSVSWESEEGKLYNLRSTTDPASADPIDWPIVAGQENLAATPPENTVTIPFPPDSTRLFVVEEFTPPPVSIFSDDFETGQDTWTVESTGETGTSWQFGTPSNFGPVAANSGAICFGTNIDANYTPLADCTLRSPVIDLSGAESATLRFAQFHDMEGLNFDWGVVRALDPLDSSEIAVIYEAVDFGTDWEEIRAAIPAAALDREIVLEFRFRSDTIQEYPGWYIDDVEVTVP